MSDEVTNTAALVEEVRAWLSANWTGTDDVTWRHALVDAGWAAPTWALDAHGRALTSEQAETVLAEFDAAGAPGASRDIAGFGANPWVQLAGNTVATFGSTALKAKFLGPLLADEVGRGCLLYSEPGAGSDLAGLQTRAERDGAEYVVNGQKVWTSGAVGADFGLLVARTNWDVPKHQGISFFIFPMRQDGVEIRPIRQITGDSHFNEVFFTDARVPAENLVGDENDGWRVLQTALAYERMGMGGAARAVSEQSTAPVPESIAGAADLIEAARAAGKIDDPVTRQAIAQLHMWRLVNAWNGERAVAGLRTGTSSSLASLGKLAMSRILHSTTAFKCRLMGPESMLYGPSDPAANELNYAMMMAFINSIGGGSDQIQRNIISERVLGLPKGPEPDRGVPFRDVRKSAAVRRLS